jgi:hypothetical protein
MRAKWLTNSVGHLYIVWVITVSSGVTLFCRSWPVSSCHWLAWVGVPRLAPPPGAGPAASSLPAQYSRIIRIHVNYTTYLLESMARPSLQGAGHQMNTFFEGLLNEISTFWTCAEGFWIFREKLLLTTQSLLASLKTVTNSKDLTESRIRIFVPAFLCCHWSIFFSVQLHVIAVPLWAADRGPVEKYS